MSRIYELAASISALDEKIRPIANRPIDISNPGWTANLDKRVHPLDEAGLRTEAEHVIEHLLSEYPKADQSGRELLRELLARNPSFAWAASLPFAADTPERFRMHVLFFSIRDLGRDSRDAYLELQALCQAAQQAGFSAEAVLEAAALSSTKNRFGTGSTRDMLLHAAGGWRRTRSL
jgi:hypothetical protein